MSRVVFFLGVITLATKHDEHGPFSSMIYLLTADSPAFEYFKKKYPVDIVVVYQRDVFLLAWQKSLDTEAASPRAVPWKPWRWKLGEPMGFSELVFASFCQIRSFPALPMKGRFLHKNVHSPNKRGQKLGKVSQPALLVEHVPYKWGPGERTLQMGSHASSLWRLFLG